MICFCRHFIRLSLALSFFCPVSVLAEDRVETLPVRDAGIWDAGHGFDTFQTASRPGLLRAEVDLNLHEVRTYYADKINLYHIYNVERVIGSIHDDRIYGSNEADVLVGDNGNDYLEGRDGKDTFVYSSSGFDTVADFRHGEDRIDVSSLRTGFGNLKFLDTPAGVQISNQTIPVMLLNGVKADSLSESDFLFSEPQKN